MNGSSPSLAARVAIASSADSGLVPARSAAFLRARSGLTLLVLSGVALTASATISRTDAASESDSALLPTSQITGSPLVPPVRVSGPSAFRIAFRHLSWADPSLAALVASGVTDALNAHLPESHRLVERRGPVREHSDGFLSFERTPAAAWLRIFDVDGVRCAVTGSLLFVLEYETGPSGDPSLPFTLDAGYFKRKGGIGFVDGTRTEIGAGTLSVPGSAGPSVRMEDAAGASRRVVDLVNDLIANPPAGAVEPVRPPGTRP